MRYNILLSRGKKKERSPRSVLMSDLMREFSASQPDTIAEYYQNGDIQHFKSEMLKIVGNLTSKMQNSAAA